MTDTASLLPRRFTGSLPRRLACLVVGVGLLAIASRIAIPMVPVPITLQTLAVTLAGALLGWRLGMLTVLVWLALGAAGMPVFAGPDAGLHKFAGPTAGYLFAFPFAAAAVGWLVGHGWNGRRALACFAAMLIGNAICLAIGAGWLGLQIGWHKALLAGVLPFLIGAALKSALAAALVVLVERYTFVHKSGSALLR